MLWTPMYSKQLIQQRAGNALSIAFPCETVPRAIGGLQNAPPFSGHDAYLGMAFGIIDCVISKPLRLTLLMKFGKYMSCSSASLMHRACLAENSNTVTSSTVIDTVYSDFKYGISFGCSLRLVKRIVAELQSITHLPEVKEFVEALIVNVLQPEGIATPAPVEGLSIGSAESEVLAFDHFSVSCSTLANLHSPIIEGTCNLIIAEQLARYTNEVIWLDVNSTLSQAWAVNTIGDTAIYVKFVTTPEQLLTIYNQRKNHKRLEWAKFCDDIKPYLQVALGKDIS